MRSPPGPFAFVLAPGIRTSEKAFGRMRLVVYRGNGLASRRSVGRGKPQYRFAIGNSSAGKWVITRQPLSVTTTSSSMRAPENPSVAGQ